MSKRTLGAIGGIAVAALVLAACGGSSSGGSSSSAAPASSGAESSAAPAGGGSVGVILPDSQSSNRWESADRKYLTEAFAAAGVEADIQNAQGDVNQSNGIIHVVDAVLLPKM